MMRYGNTYSDQGMATLLSKMPRVNQCLCRSYAGSREDTQTFLEPRSRRWYQVVNLRLSLAQRVARSPHGVAPNKSTFCVPMN